MRSRARGVDPAFEYGPRRHAYQLLAAGARLRTGRVLHRFGPRGQDRLLSSKGEDIDVGAGVHCTVVVIRDALDNALMAMNP